MDSPPTVEELKDYLCMPDAKDEQYKGMLRLVAGYEGNPHVVDAHTHSVPKDEFFWLEWLPARRGLATRH